MDSPIQSEYKGELPLVSVIVPVYNASRTLGKCLESLKIQDYDNLEVIFVDDGSKDDSVALIKGSGFRVVLSPVNQGQSLARNLGLEMSRGELVCFFDSDVILRRETVSLLVSSLDEYDCDAVSGNYMTESADTNPCSRFYSYLKSFGHGANVVRDHNILGTYCCIVRKKFLERVGGFRPFPPGMDIECEAIGRRLRMEGCRFIFNPLIRVWHHFGGCRKIFYVFSNRVYWYVRYKGLIRDESEPVRMRGMSMTAAVGAYTAFSLCGIFCFLSTIFPITDHSVGALGFCSLVGLAVGTVLMSRFFFFTLRQGGLPLTLFILLCTPFYFAVGGISGIAGGFVSTFYKLTGTEDKLSELLGK